MILLIDPAVHLLLNLVVNLHQFAVVSRHLSRIRGGITDQKAKVLALSLNHGLQVGADPVRRSPGAGIDKAVAAVLIGHLVEIPVHLLFKALAFGSVDGAVLQILSHHLAAIGASPGLNPVRLPAVVVGHALDLIVLQVDVQVAQPGKTVVVSSHRVLPGHVHVVPLAVQLDQVPGVGAAVYIPDLQPAGLCRLQKRIRVTGALCLALHDAAVTGCPGPVLGLLIAAILHQPFDDHDLLLEIAHAGGDIGVLEIRNGLLHLLPLVGVHHPVVAVLKIVGRTADRIVGIIAPLKILPINAAVAAPASTAGTASSTGTSRCTSTGAGYRASWTLGGDVHGHSGGNPLPLLVMRNAVSVHPGSRSIHPATVRRDAVRRHGAALRRVQIITFPVDPLPAAHQAAPWPSDPGVQEIPPAVIQQPAGL